MTHFHLPLMLMTAQLASAQIATQWSQMPPLPSAHGFASPVVGNCGGHLLHAGGSNFPDAPLWAGGKKVWHSAIYVLGSDGAEWRHVGDLPRPLAHAVGLSHRGVFYILGGQNGEGVRAEVLSLRWVDNAVEVRAELPPLPEPMAMAAGAVVGDTLYLAGGIGQAANPEPLSAAYSLDLEDTASGWKRLPDWPGPPRCLAAAGELDGRFVLVGGLSRLNDLAADAYLSDAFIYDAESGWSPLPALTHRAATALTPIPVSRNRSLILVGGVDGDGLGQDPQTYPQVPRRVQVLESGARNWVEGLPTPRGWATAQCVPWADGWFVSTAETSPGVRSPETWMLRVAEK